MNWVFCAFVWHNHNTHKNGYWLPLVETTLGCPYGYFAVVLVSCCSCCSCWNCWNCWNCRLSCSFSCSFCWWCWLSMSRASNFSAAPRRFGVSGLISSFSVCVLFFFWTCNLHHLTFFSKFTWTLVYTDHSGWFSLIEMALTLIVQNVFWFVCCTSSFFLLLSIFLVEYFFWQATSMSCPGFFWK